MLQIKSWELESFFEAMNIFAVFQEKTPFLEKIL